MIKKLLLLSLFALPVQAMEYWQDMSVDRESSNVMMYNYNTGEYAYGMRNSQGGIYIYDRDSWYDSGCDNYDDYDYEYRYDEEY